MNTYRQFIINPGSTSTKIAIFENEREVFGETLRHSTEELAAFPSVIDQFHFRLGIIKSALQNQPAGSGQLNAIVGRGGLLRPISGGTYTINETMLEDLRQEKRGAHASNLGALLAHALAEELAVPAFIVDPVCVDEMEPLARISGLPEVPRESLFHALNQKAIGRRVARELNSSYGDLNLIIAHMGGGITVGAHRKGRVIDVNNAIPGEGPFSPERSGGVPAGGLAGLCFSGKYSRQEIGRMLVGAGGLAAYLGTIDGREIEQRIAQGDEKARLIYEAMAYQVAKEIGACSVVLAGQVDCIAVTGGLAYSSMLVHWITERVAFIAPVRIYPGEEEMQALAEGGLRVLRGEETPLDY